MSCSISKRLGKRQIARILTDSKIKQNVGGFSCRVEFFEHILVGLVAGIAFHLFTLLSCECRGRTVFQLLTSHNIDDTHKGGRAVSARPCLGLNSTTSIFFSNTDGYT